jgi:DNA-binding GntR family transcriptional regulator
VISSGGESVKPPSTILGLPKSTSDRVYDFLKNEILSQNLAPGERLLERIITRTVNVSRTPVREAFRRLEQEGLVIRSHQGGVQVTELSPESLDDVSEIRAMIEAYACDLACERIQPEAIGELQEIIQQARVVLDNFHVNPIAQVNKLSALNTRFHDTIYGATHNDYLIKILDVVRLPILRFRPFSLMDERHRRVSWDEHKRMIDLLAGREKAKLKQLIMKHVRDVNEAVSRSLKKLRESSSRPAGPGPTV